jgi:hypothetical protein
MLLVLGIIVLVGALGIGALAFMADAMSDAPSAEGIPLWPFVIAAGVGVLLIIAWFFVGGAPIVLHW